MKNEELLCSVIAQPILHSSFFIQICSDLRQTHSDYAANVSVIQRSKATKDLLSYTHKEEILPPFGRLNDRQIRF